MKKNILIFSAMLIAVLFASCEYDNYDSPSLVMSGRLLHNGKAFYYDGNPDRGLLKVVQKGFGKVDGGTYLRVDEQGTYQQLLFAGEYWFTPANNQYPFEFKDFNSLGSGLGYDSIYMNLSSNLEKNLEVIPYFTISNFRVTTENENIVMRFKVEKTPGTKKTDAKIIRARAYVNTAVLVNSKTVCNTAKDMVITDNGDVEISIPLKGSGAYRTAYVNNFRTYAFCRVAVELENTPNYYLFSETLKVDNLPL